MTRGVAAVAAVAVLWSGTAGAAQPLSLDAVLARTGAYVASYYAQLAGIVAEERYEQQVLQQGRRGLNRQYRILRSDLLLVRPANEAQWLQFRDVFEVDRKPIRDRDERLYKLFLDAKPDARQQAQLIMQESSRFNIGPLQRNLNTPIMALAFFEPQVQRIMKYERAKSGNVKALASLAAPDAIWMIQYRETQEGTFVRGPGGRDVPSHGRVWIDSTSGRILRSEQISVDTSVQATIDVTYRAEPGLDLLVPGEMSERYYLGRFDTRIHGKATYSRFRRFTVTTNEKPKPGS